jgi:carbon-monoxide dehydrogenase medium subunit
MKPPPFTYHRPASLDEALALLGEHGDQAKILAGGQSLVPLLSLRLAHPSHLVDINRLNGSLTQIADQDGGLTIGALVRQRSAEQSATVKQRSPLLAEALPLIGHTQIRNRGTICGNLAHADPASELPAVALVLEAQMVAASRRGERTIPADSFFNGMFSTALEPDELLTQVKLPAWPRGAGWSFQEVARRHGDFALAGVAAVVQLDATGAVCTEVRLAAIGVGPAPVRGRAAEAALRGQAMSPDAVSGAAQALSQAIDPASDVQATAAYRRHVTAVLARRALDEAAARARSSAAKEG